MATYTELFEIRNDSQLKNKITSAIAVAAHAITQESDQTANHANRLLWAKEALSSPESMADRMLWGILAANSGAAVGSITSATDPVILSAVNVLVNTYATGG